MKTVHLLVIHLIIFLTFLDSLYSTTMEEYSGDNTIIEVEAPIIDPVTVIDVPDEEVELVEDTEDVESVTSIESYKSAKVTALPSIFSSTKRLLTGTILLTLLIVPTIGAGYIKYQMRKELYKPVVEADDFPYVPYDATDPFKDYYEYKENVDPDF